MQYLPLKIVKNMQVYRKCTEAPPFRAISGGASRRKRGHRGSILPNNGLLQSNQPADRYKYCASCFKSVSSEGLNGA